MMRTHVVCKEYAPDRGDCARLVVLPVQRAPYLCLGCGYTWVGLAGPTSCPQCAHPYVRWLQL